MSRLEDSRREFESQVQEMRAALASQVGWAPRGKWILPLIAAAAGLAAATWLRRSQRHRLTGRSRSRLR